MTDEKGCQGYANYQTYCVHLWITSDDEPYKYWANLAHKLLIEQEHPREHLRDALQAHFKDAAPKLEGMWSDLMAKLEEVKWMGIATALTEDIERKDYDLHPMPRP
jgi:hypothetical protein